MDDNDGNDSEWSVHEYIGNTAVPSSTNGKTQSALNVLEVFALANLNLLTGLWLWKEGVAALPASESPIAFCKEYSIAVRVIISLTLVTSLAFGPRWDGTRGREVPHGHRDRRSITAVLRAPLR